MSASASVPALTVEEIDPVSVEQFLDAFPTQGSSTFVLDGGDFAFLGAEPVCLLRASRADMSGSREHAPLPLHVTVERQGAVSRLSGARPLATLRELLEHYMPRGLARSGEAVPFRFHAGAVGYIGYEYGQTLEHLPAPPRPCATPMPDVAFAIHRWSIAIERKTQRTWLSVIAPREEAAKLRAHVRAALASSRQAHVRRGAAPEPVIEATLSRAEYLARIATAKQHIKAGDTFEVCLTNAHTCSPVARGDAHALFHELRRANPAPYAAFLDLPEGAIVSSSPERFLSFESASRVAESRPIKGTRPRGKTPAEDAVLIRDLATSEKDRAENAMIVDLVRNDLGKVCRFGSVEVPSIYAVETYPTVHQLVSTVRGALRDDKDAFDLIDACFPPGSMTGAPKIETMRILETLEPVERGVYSGALGYVAHDGSVDLSVVIRTLVIGNDGVASFSVGGAIVADSDPAAEHEETLHKARALVAALAASSSPTSKRFLAPASSARWAEGAE